MEHTIYFNRKPLILTDDRAAFQKLHAGKAGFVFQDGMNEASVEAVIERLNDDAVSGYGIAHTSANDLLDVFKKKMIVIQAGGGLVHVGKSVILMIYRRGKWDLPKGKLDAGETVAEAALREVAEETGLRNLHLELPLTVTYHTYMENRNLILKESHWFLMESETKQQPVPQLDEDIEICKWVGFEDLNAYLENTHPSIIDVLKAGTAKLKVAKRG